MLQMLTRPTSKSAACAHKLESLTMSHAQKEMPASAGITMKEGGLSVKKVGQDGEGEGPAGGGADVP